MHLDQAQIILSRLWKLEVNGRINDSLMNDMFILLTSNGTAKSIEL